MSARPRQRRHSIESQGDRTWLRTKARRIQGAPRRQDSPQYTGHDDPLKVREPLYSTAPAGYREWSASTSPGPPQWALNRDEPKKGPETQVDLAGVTSIT